MKFPVATNNLDIARKLRKIFCTHNAALKYLKDRAYLPPVLTGGK